MLILLLTGAIAPAAGAAGEASEPRTRWGMNVPAVDPLTEAGAKPDLAMVWVGVWNDGNWGSVERTLQGLRARGVTPLVQWYYWGDDISPDCVENGCWSSLHGANKTKAHWYKMLGDLQSVLARTMEGDEVVVVVETEFNKGRIPAHEYAPTFDVYLREHMDALHNVTGVKTVAGFGTWYPQAWDRFPLTVEGADYVAMQALRSSVRNTPESYLGAVDALVSSAQTMNEKFPGKEIFITDMGYSSYPEPEYAEHQETVIREFFARLPELEARGVRAFMYRGLFDVPMDTNNYHGEAERWWGLKHQDRTAKPAYAAWLEGVGATPPPPPPGVPVPATLEAEAMSASAGGRQSDSRASGGAAWNLWSNGHLEEHVNATETGTYRFTIHARGSHAFGEWPAMSAFIGETRTGQWAVNGTSYGAYAFEADLVKGDSTRFRVAFTNDRYDPATGDDRNLVVDRAVVTYVPPANHAPAADFTASGENLTVSVDASASSDPEGDALSYAWAFGDGATATGVTAQHTYAASGTFEITLTVTDARGASATATRTATVERSNAAPSAAFDWNASGLNATFDASASHDPDGDALAYAWQFGDGATATGASVTHAYAEAGAYNVTLTVSDPDGASSTATRTVNVERPNRAPVAAFDATQDGLAVSVDASASADPDGDALAYAWRFGDGATATGVTATHAYAEDGTFNITLTVTDARGASAARRETVTVEKPNTPPSAAFEWTADALTATFDASASSDADGDALSYAWTLGDGASATGASVTHAYAEAGAYNVTLTVSDGKDAASTTRVVEVTPPPKPDPVQHREAEHFAVKTTGGRFADPYASEHAGWNVWSNGEISDTFVAAESGEHVLRVTARGNPALGEFPRMEVRVDGALAGAFTVTHDWAAYDVRVPLEAGERTRVSVAFVNDLYDRTSGDDRNLHVDVVRLVAPSVLTLEAEQFKVATTGGRFNDASLSGNAGWNVWGNGYIAEGFDAPATGAYRVSVMARGDASAGIDPVMRVLVDGAVVGETAVASDRYRSYAFDVRLTAGAHEVRIAFVNDHYDPVRGHDRNLRVDYARLESA